MPYADPTRRLITPSVLFVRSVAALSALCGAGSAGAQVIAGCANGALPVQAYDRSSGDYSAVANLGTVPVRGLAVDDARRIMYMASGSYLYRIPYDEPRAAVRIGAFHGDAATIDGGLAYDSARGMLLGTAGTQANFFYQIDTETAETHLVLALGAGDFGGIDYDPVGDVLYGADDSASSSAGLSGRGLYRITLPLTAASFTRIAGYPIKSGTSTEIDIDGVGVGGGRVYMCADETNWMYVYNLTTNSYETPVAQTAFGTDRFSCGATYAPSYFLSPLPDAAAAVTAPPDCTIHAMEHAVFRAGVRNAGTAGLTGVTLRAAIPAGASLVSSEPAGSVIGGVLTVTIGDLAAAEFAPVAITLAPINAGTLTLTVLAGSAQSEPDMSNNSATAATRVLPAAPGAAPTVAIASTLAGSASAEVPGLPGVRYRNAGVDSFGPPTSSPDGARLMFVASADSGPPGTDKLVMRVDGDAASLVGRQGVFPVVPGGAGAPVEITSRLSVNDSGAWAMAGRDATGPFVARVVNGFAQTVARAGQLVPAYGGDVLYGSVLSSPSIAGDGGVSFGASLAGPGVGTGTGEAALSVDGAVVLVRSGMDIPYGQRDANGFETYYFVRSLDLEADATPLSVSGAGDRFAVGGFLNGPGGSDRVLIREHPFGGPAIAVQESRPVAALGANAAAESPVAYAALSPGGLITIGSAASGRDFVLRDESLLALGGELLSAGSTERWSSSAGAFAGAASNSAGDWVVVGVTDRADPLANTAAVLNGATVLARENDPVDLDGNGVFDDGAYIGEFVPFRCALGRDRFVAAVRLRSESAATGCGADDTIGYALIAAAFSPAPDFCAADFNQDGGIDGGDVEAFFVAWESAESLADVNQDGGIDGADVEAFFNLWEAGGCP